MELPRVVSFSVKRFNFAGLLTRWVTLQRAIRASLRRGLQSIVGSPLPDVAIDTINTIPLTDFVTLAGVIVALLVTAALANARWLLPLTGWFSVSALIALIGHWYAKYLREVKNQRRRPAVILLLSSLLAVAVAYVSVRPILAQALTPPPSPLPSVSLVNSEVKLIRPHANGRVIPYLHAVLKFGSVTGQYRATALFTRVNFPLSDDDQRTACEVMLYKLKWIAPLNLGSDWYDFTAGSTNSFAINIIPGSGEIPASLFNPKHGVVYGIYVEMRRASDLVAADSVSFTGVIEFSNPSRYQCPSS